MGGQCHTYQGEKWEGKWCLAADDTFSFVPVEGEVMLGSVEGRSWWQFLVACGSLYPAARDMKMKRA